MQLYSNQGVSCRNIGQEQLRVTQSMEKGDSNGPLYHGKESKMMLYIADLARSFSIVHRKLFWGARAEILLLCAEILPFWASCRNITIQAKDERFVSRYIVNAIYCIIWKYRHIAIFRKYRDIFSA